jgi:galactose mutarotase-like enzyme
MKSKKSGKEYMWDANPAVWGSHAPVLFPIIGCLKDNHYFYKGKQFSVPKHGMIRNNRTLQVSEQTKNNVSFTLKYNDETLKAYPFQFEFTINYILHGNILLVEHVIVNGGNDSMLFSLGGHPAFKCPVNAGEVYEDYYLEFEKNEIASTWELDQNGLVTNRTTPVLENTNLLALHGNLFNKDALIFKNLKSSSVSLKSKKSKQVLTVNYKDFPYLGIWAKPKSNFVCIEPWLGITDNFISDGNFETKEGILKLEAGKEFNAAYLIEIKE